MKQIFYTFLAGAIMISCNQNQAKNDNQNKTKDSPASLTQNSTTNPENTAALDCSGYVFKNPKDRADTLIKYYKLATAGSGKEPSYDQKIFCAFPNSFKEMQEVFGFDDKLGSAPLYDHPLGGNILKYFSQMATIPKDLYYDKYVNICINGAWEADNIEEAFGLHEKLVNDTKASCARLAARNDEEIKSVFRFIFDGPHPNNDENKKLYDQLQKKIDNQDKRLSKLFTESYNQLMRDDDEHEH